MKKDDKPNLLDMRQSRGWTQQETAENAGISRSYYAMLETCGRAPSVNVARKLARVFDIEWHMFFNAG